MYGWANADRLRPNARGIASMAGYMVQDSAGKKHWTQSQKSGKAVAPGTDDREVHAPSVGQDRQAAEDSEEFVRFWEKQYRGWELVECEKSFNEQTGWYFYLDHAASARKQNGGLK